MAAKKPRANGGKHNEMMQSKNQQNRSLDPSFPQPECAVRPIFNPILLLLVMGVLVSQLPFSL